MRRIIGSGVTACVLLFMGSQLRAQNLRALWHLDAGSGTTISDSSGNGNTGCFPSIVNAVGSPCFGTFGGASDDPAWSAAAASKFGASSLSTDADDLVFVPSSASLSPTTAITVEAWVKVDSYSGSVACIVCKATGTAATNGYSLFMLPSAGSYVPAFAIADSTPGHLSHAVAGGKVTPGDGKWHHVAGTYDGASVQVFLDGNGVGFLSFAGSINTTATPLLIGALNSGSPTFFFPAGKIDEVRIWGRALNGGEIRTSDQNALHGLWHFDTLTGALTTPDSSGYNNTGTFSSAAAGDSPLVTSPIMPASFGKALTFDGEDQVTVASTPELTIASQNLSISLFVATDASFSALTAQRILGKRMACATGTPEYEISQNASGKLVFTSGSFSITGSAGLTAGGTFHIAVITGPGAGNTTTLYLNGAAIGSAMGFIAPAATTAPLQIGNSGSCTTSTTPTGLNHATIDEVSIYGSAVFVAALSGSTAAGTANDAGDQFRAPLVLPGTIGEELGSGVVGPTDWSFGATSPGMALGFYVPIDPNGGLTSITVREHGFESTPRGTCGDVLGSSGTGPSGVGTRVFITATNDDTASCTGPAAQTVHFEGNLFLGGDIGLNIHWP